MVSRRPLVISAGSTQELPPGDVIVGSRVLVPTSTKTGNYTASAGELVICDASGGSFTVTLPAASASVSVAVRKADSSSNAVVVAAAGSDTIGVVSTTTSFPIMLPGQVWEAVAISGAWVMTSSPTQDAWLGIAATTVLPGVVSVLTATATYFNRVTRGFARLATKVGFVVGTPSGNVSVGVYRNSGVGTAAVPSGAPVASTGSVACPGGGYAELTLNTAVDVIPGDWLALSVDNATASFFVLTTNTAPVGVLSARQVAFPAPSPVGTLIGSTKFLQMYAVS